METLNPSSLTDAFSHLIAQIAITPPGARLAAVSGQVAVDRAGQLIGGNDHSAQARQCFGNVLDALAAIKAHPKDILQMRLYVVRHTPDLVPALFGAGSDIFGDKWPVCASTWIGVEALAMPEWLVEIEVLVALP
ncbi:RidA family protein [Agrobacterium sp. S2/73]|uniref:RidA family protein n=1 Tax=unclassified Agrobacterium TaxID=2632611 RepID=UPI001ADC3852|nr:MULTISPECIES: RidA family protein [unclassified Agrobacterium]MBO9111953.1 RidA family protein [Agrobacterium sp. S2/73]QXZ76313.1 RidA family protein [Agrobacterium sp. S7/73]